MVGRLIDAISVLARGTGRWRLEHTPRAHNMCVVDQVGRLFSVSAELRRFFFVVGWRIQSHTLQRKGWKRRLRFRESLVVLPYCFAQGDLQHRPLFGGALGARDCAHSGPVPWPKEGLNSSGAGTRYSEGRTKVVQRA